MSSLRALAVIPARGGSKGVPRKNLRLIAGEPLLAYAIRAAQQSARLTHFVTTTDDEEIASVAERYGCPVVHRPQDLAQDDSPVVLAVRHALEETERTHNTCFDAIVLLQPTAPFREGQDVDAVLAMLEDDPAVDSVVSVVAVEDAHPARMYRVDREGWMLPLSPEWETARRQDLPPIYHRNGALYACRRRLLVEQGAVIGPRKKAYVMPREWAANVDTEADLLLADLLAQRWKGR